MAHKALSRDEIAFGRAVLLATDSFAMSAEGAFWLYDSDADKWRYILVTSLFRRLGPRKTFLRLNRALQEKLSESEITEFEFFIADPDEVIVEPIRKKIETSPNASSPQEIKINGAANLTSAVVYRMAHPMTDKEVKTVQRRFTRQYNMLVPA